MSGTFDGLSNIYQISAQIDALKNAEQNTSAALGASSAGGINATDPNSFLIQSEQNFNTMLNALTTTQDDQQQQTNSSDPFSFLNNNNQNPLTATQNSADLQRLNALEQNSAMLGKAVIYRNGGAENSGVIQKILIDQNSTPVFVLTDGSQIPISAVIGLKN